jgi:hypothetical protein
LNPATIAASEPTVWLRCPSDWHRSLRPAPAARSALRKKVRAFSSIGGGGCKRQNPAGRREAKAERWNNGNALRNSEKNQAPMPGSPVQELFERQKSYLIARSRTRRKPRITRRASKQATDSILNT